MKAVAMLLGSVALWRASQGDPSGPAGSAEGSPAPGPPGPSGGVGVPTVAAPQELPVSLAWEREAKEASQVSAARSLT